MMNGIVVCQASEPKILSESYVIFHIIGLGAGR
jgi:hypothetical protein